MEKSVGMPLFFLRDPETHLRPLCVGLTVPSVHAGFLSFAKVTHPQFQQPAETEPPVLVLVLRGTSLSVCASQWGVVLFLRAVGLFHNCLEKTEGSLKAGSSVPPPSYPILSHGFFILPTRQLSVRNSSVWIFLMVCELVSSPPPPLLPGWGTGL